MYIQDVFKLIEARKEEGHFAGPISSESIAKVQELLEVVLPHSYTLFLEKYGCGGLFGMEIYGIVSDDNIEGTGIPSLVWMTRNLRETEQLPEKYIPVSFADDGAYYILNTKAMSEGECPVMIWEDGNLNDEITYISFAEFLMEEVLQSDE